MYFAKMCAHINRYTIRRTSGTSTYIYYKIMIISVERYSVKLDVQTSKYLLYNKAVSIKTTVL